ncbi:MAG: DUF167 domain-containing protein [Actinomycetales bacterium]|nr:DUF167 domain-containing protein [Actinomycetales bacterium]
MPQRQDDHLAISVRVRPGASRQLVGGGYGDPPALVVAVSAPAVDGRANEAVLRALAEAFEVPRRDVHLLTGAMSRTKLVRVAGSAHTLALRLHELLGA